jgi:hypothetical protein
MGSVGHTRPLLLGEGIRYTGRQALAIVCQGGDRDGAVSAEEEFPLEAGGRWRRSGKYPTEPICGLEADVMKCPLIKS